MVSSLIAGEIQFSVGGGDSVIRSALRGADTVLVASPLKTGLQRLMTRADIKTPAELKGKKIAITRFGSASHWVLQLFLRKWGMRAEDIQMLQLGSSPAMYATLDKGGVDGGVFTIPTFFVAEERGYRILADPVDMDIYYLQNSVDSTRSFLRKRGTNRCASSKRSAKASPTSKRTRRKASPCCKRSCAFSRRRRRTSNISKRPTIY